MGVVLDEEDGKSSEVVGVQSCTTMRMCLTPATYFKTVKRVNFMLCIFYLPHLAKRLQRKENRGSVLLLLCMTSLGRQHCGDSLVCKG